MGERDEDFESDEKVGRIMIHETKIPKTWFCVFDSLYEAVKDRLGSDCHGVWVVDGIRTIYDNICSPILRDLMKICR